MQLVIQEEQPALFSHGEVIDSAAIIPAAGKAAAKLVLYDGEPSQRVWISPADAHKLGLAVLEATPAELAMLRGAGYRLPVTSLPEPARGKGRKKGD